MELINDNFQNFKRYNVPKAQLIIADIPYNVGNKAYGSNPQWYKDGDNKNGESELAGACFFDTEGYFRIAEYMHFVSRMLKPEPKGTKKELIEKKREPGCMVIFCAFEQQQGLVELAKKHGFPNYIPLTFYKNYSAQVLKANMRPVGNMEYALVFYRDKLPKFRNTDEMGNRHMVFTCQPWERDNKTPKIHPTQKPIGVLKRIIQTFTDKGDVVIDPVAGSGTTLLAAEMLGRKAYGFEIKKDFCKEFHEQLEPLAQEQNLLELMT